MSKALKRHKLPRAGAAVLFAVIVAFILIVTLIISTVVTAVRFSADTMLADLATQRARVAALSLDPGPKTDEQSIALFDLATDPKINEVQTIITHNSYKENFNPFVRAIIEAFVPATGKPALIYEHATITDQLNDGVRGLELDWRVQDDGIKIFHFPVVDTHTHGSSWELTLEEILIWSNNNPDHFPITVLMEHKNDVKLLNPKALPINGDTIKNINKAITDVFPRDKILTPSDVIGDYANMGEAVAANNWSRYSEAKGKVIFLLHPDDVLTDEYVKLAPTMGDDLNMFASVLAVDFEKRPEYKTYIGHILGGYVAPLELSKYVKDNYIVRTRADADFKIDEQMRDAAFASGVQLISTDFVKSLVYPDVDYIVAFAGGKMLRKN
ncbi:MAG: phosphatidylinositol-specific phospholipase C1-like protein [Clostridiaceae bacterium]|jgi:hypothetical protein|nr:phosphatidylinositol-specific phospholipase C1-like protein [Clostridiaceae bacterium]